MVGEVRQWLHVLRRTDPGTSRQISDALDLLAAEGPTLGRPIVDRVKGSSLHHLKELRPGSARASEIRNLFAFDPGSNAVLLVVGDRLVAGGVGTPTPFPSPNSGSTSGSRRLKRDRVAHLGRGPGRVG